MKSSEMSVLFLSADGKPIGIAPYTHIECLQFGSRGVRVTLRDGLSFCAANDRKDIRRQIGVFRLWKLLKQKRED